MAPLMAMTPGSRAAAERAASPTRPPSAEGPVRVVWVADGDTVWVSVFGHRVKIRIVGIDTPEIAHPGQTEECGARAASDRAHELLEGKLVWVTHDRSAGSKDKYGRTLSHLWLADGSLFSLQMAEEGWAVAYRARNAYRAQITDAVERAQRGKRGMWATCAVPAT